MKQQILFLFSILLGIGGFSAMLFWYRRVQLYAQELGKALAKARSFESEIFSLAGKNYQQSTKLAEALEARKTALEINRQSEAEKAELTIAFNKASDLAAHLESNLSTLQKNKKEIEDKLYGEVKNLTEQIHSLNKTIELNQKDNHELRLKNEKKQEKIQTYEMENLDKNRETAQLKEQLANEQLQTRSVTDLMQTQTASIEFLQKQAEELKSKLSDQELVDTMKKELAKQLRIAQGAIEKSVRVDQINWSLKGQKEMLEERNRNWETALRYMSEHILGKKNQHSKSAPIGLVIGNALEAIERCLIVEDFHQSPDNQFDELDFLSQLTNTSAASGSQKRSEDLLLEMRSSGVSRHE